MLAEANEDINIKKKGLDLSPGYSGRKHFFKRTFGRLDKGSLRGSIFSLCASAIGSGVLSLPYILALNGWVIGILLICLGGFAAIWSLFLIAEGAIQAKVKNFSQLANKAGGNFLEKVLQWNILVYLIGCCISFQIISKQWNH
jgi:amino acid permease